MADKENQFDPYADDYKINVMPNFKVQTQVPDNQTGEDTRFLPEPEYLPIQPNSKPLQVTDLDKMPDSGPGFFSNLAHAFAEENTAIAGMGSLFSHVGLQMNVSDAYDPDFNPYQEQYLADYPQKWWSYLANSKNEQELQLKQQYINKQLENEEYYNNGSFMSSFIGGGLGFATSPESLLIPIASSIKYARVSENILRNTMAAMPGITTQVAAHEMLQEQIKAQDDMENFAYNTFRDALFGMALHGGIQAFSGGVTSAKINNARKINSFLHKGVDTDIEVDIGGGNPRLKARPTTAESAKYVDDAQRFMDSEMARSGLYSVPYVGKLSEKVSQSVSPIVWGKSSRFKTTNALTDLFADNTIITRGMDEGKAIPDSAEFLRDYYTAQSQQNVHQIMGMFYESNGMKADGASAVNSLKSMAQHFAGKQELDYWDYGKQILTVANTKELTSNKTINEAAEIFGQDLENTWYRFAEVNGFDPTQQTVHNAKSYAMTIVNHNKLISDDEGFIDHFVNDVGEQKEHVAELQQPLNEINERIANHEQLIGDTPEEIKTNAETLKSLRDEKKQIQAEITETLMEPDNFYMRENQNFITPDELKDLKEFLKPLDEAKDFHKEKVESFELNKKQVSQLEKDIKAIRSKIRKAATAHEKAKTEATKQKKIQLIEDEKQNLESTQSELDERKANLEETEQLMINAEEEIGKIESELKSSAEAGELNRNLYYADTDGKVLKFKSENDLPRLKTSFPDDLRKAGRQEWEKRAHYTPEQILQSVLGSEFPHMFENPLKSRTTLLRYDKMLQAGWLETDAPKLLMNYSRTMNSIIALKEKYADLNLANGPEDFARNLKQEYDLMRQQVVDAADNKLKEAKTDAEKEKITQTKDKEIKKLNKDLESNRKFINKMYRAYFRQYDYSPKVRKVVRGLRNIAAMTRLGNVPITQIADIGSMILKVGFWPLIKNNAELLLRQLNHSLRDDRERVMRSARNNFMGVNHALDVQQDLFHNSQYMSELRTGDRISTVFDTMGQVSGNMSLMNHVDNWSQSLVSTSHAANIMDALHDFKEGKLKPRDREMLLKYGLEPESWADRMIEQFNEYGFVGDFGGRHSRYYDWTDFEAQQRFRKSLMRATRDTVLRKGTFEGPFMSNDPVLGMLLLFKGYAFSAFNRFTVPIMQSPDLQKMVGVFSMLALGAMVDPLKKLAKGQEVNFDDEAWFTNALTDGNPLGVLMDGFQDVNNIMHGQLLQGVHNERWRNRSILGVLGGPIPGLMQDAVDVLTQYWTGQINERDTKKALRMIPFSQMWYFRGISNQFLDSLNLPKSPDSAEPYFWRDTQ